MGAFFRSDIIDTKTTGFVFLLMLSCGRILLFRNPALQYAGIDRLQIVGVGSLHINGPLEWLPRPAPVLSLLVLPLPVTGSSSR